METQTHRTSFKVPTDLWIFGYGSLIWKNYDVPHTDSKVCYVKGYKRRAWQGSTDHRGTLEEPGRVVSIYTPADFQQCGIVEKDKHEMIHPDDDKWVVHGIAFKVTEQHRHEVVSSLEIREIDGYEPLWLPLYADENENAPSSLAFVERALTYVAPPTNPRFLGFVPHRQIASHIRIARGMSGSNFEYISNLNDALCRMGRPDNHISSITEMARSMQ